MEWQADQAHNHLPLLPPQGEFETVAILKACIPARVLEKTCLLPESKALLARVKISVLKDFIQSG